MKNLSHVSTLLLLLVTGEQLAHIWAREHDLAPKQSSLKLRNLQGCVSGNGVCYNPGEGVDKTCCDSGQDCNTAVSGSSTNRKCGASTSTSTATASTNCFSALTTVEVKNKGSVPLPEVQVGDDILVSQEDGGYSRVYAFAHRDTTAVVEFLQIYSSKNLTNSALPLPPLEVTGEHLIYLQGKRNPVRADSIQVGQVLQGGNRDHAVTVTKIDTIERQGLYAPLTFQGDLMVNDGMIRASSYVALQQDVKMTGEYATLQGDMLTGVMSQHGFVHLTLSPYRMWCMMDSKNLCHSSWTHENGMQSYVGNGIHILEWCDRQPLLVQMMLLVAFGIVFGACWAVEQTILLGFGSAWIRGLTFLLIAGASTWMASTTTLPATFEGEDPPKRKVL